MKKLFLYLLPIFLLSGSAYAMSVSTEVYVDSIQSGYAYDHFIGDFGSPTEETPNYDDNNGRYIDYYGIWVMPSGEKLKIQFTDTSRISAVYVDGVLVRDFAKREKQYNFLSGSAEVLTRNIQHANTYSDLIAMLGNPVAAGPINGGWSAVWINSLGEKITIIFGGFGDVVQLMYINKELVLDFSPKKTDAWEARYKEYEPDEEDNKRIKEEAAARYNKNAKPVSVADINNFILQLGKKRLNVADCEKRFGKPYTKGFYKGDPVYDIGKGPLKEYEYSTTKGESFEVVFDKLGTIRIIYLNVKKIWSSSNEIALIDTLKKKPLNYVDCKRMLGIPKSVSYYKKAPVIIETRKIGIMAVWRTDMEQDIDAYFDVFDNIKIVRLSGETIWLSAE